MAHKGPIKAHNGPWVASLEVMAPQGAQEGPKGSFRSVHPHIIFFFFTCFQTFGPPPPMLWGPETKLRVLPPATGGPDLSTTLPTTKAKKSTNSVVHNNIHRCTGKDVMDVS